MNSILTSLFVFVVLCLALVIAADIHPRLTAVPTESEAVELFAKFKADHSRVYASVEEEAEKFEHFKATLEEIVYRNNLGDTATFAVSKFADWSKAEKKAMMGGMAPSDYVYKPRENKASDATDCIFPTDNRDRNLVTPVKNQGGCGACWAFGASEMVEVAWALAGKGLNSLSAQQFVDCCNNPWCTGCAGGNSMMAVYDAVDNHGGGVDLESSYPYTATQSATCNFKNGSAIGAYVSNVNTLGDEYSLYQQIQTSPVTIMIDANSLPSYSSGYLTSSNCDNSTLNHFVQVVGIQYWSATDVTPVWIIKNQWGEGWGQDGYFYVAYNQGACLVGEVSYYAV